MADANETRVAVKEGVGRTLAVAALVSLVCSSLVASAAVLLRPQQERNKALDVQRNILEVSGLLEPGTDIAERFSRIETRIVDFESGTYVEHVDASAFDPTEAAEDPNRSVKLPSVDDTARIRRRPHWGLVYVSREGSAAQRIILPVRGAGLWSTMHGLIALEPDGNTVATLTFYEHGETPGLGDQIGKPAWRALWPGKRVYDEQGRLKLAVVKGRVPPSDPEAVHHIDGITGATLTSRGVSNLLRYWLGDHAYGPYLNRVRRGELTP